MAQQTIQRSFAAGELAPVLHSRADQAKYQSGLKTCRNFMVRREGGVSNRAGFGLVEAAKTDDAGTKFMRFVPSSGSGYLIEMGSGYFRFHRNGAQLTVTGVPAWNNATPYVAGDLVISGGIIYYCHTPNTNQIPPDGAFWSPMTMVDATTAIYEIPTPYALGALPDWNQSGNVITLTVHGQQPRELVFVNSVRWIIRLVTTSPTIAAPGGLSAVAGAAGALTYAYQVTAAAAETYEESASSGSTTLVGCAEPTAALPNVVSWGAVTGAAEYYVYADIAGNGVFGFIGTATGTSFRDTGLVPDFNVTPPIPRVLFTAVGNFPAHSSNYQQRRFFVNTEDEGDAIYGSRTGFPSNFGIASPLQDDDAITFRLAGNNNHAIEHAVALRAGLVLLTGGGEWTLTGGGGPKTPITPSSIDAEQETYVGISSVRPVIIGNAIIYVQARGAVMRELSFDQAVEGLAGKDLSIWSTHLFEQRKTIVAMDFQQVPHSIVWSVLSDGTLASMTYIPEQEVAGWHRHDSWTNDGATLIQSQFEEVCVVPESGEDAVYVLVSRTIGGVVKRFVERLERRDIRTAFFSRDAFFVDSGLEYSGAGANTFTGLDHLEGQVVAVLADGNVLYDGDPAGANAASFTVNAGGLDLPGDTLYAEVKIGLAIRYPDLETLDLDVQGSDIRDKRKQTNAVTLLIDRSARSFSAGPTFDVADLRRYDVQPWETNAQEATGPYELQIPTAGDKPGRVCIRMTEPLPLTILGIIPSTDVGG